MPFRSTPERSGFGEPRPGPRLRAAALALLLLGFVPAAAGAQLASNTVVGGQAAPRVFLQCEDLTVCNAGRLQTDIQWVNWVSAIEEATVHVRVLAEPAASAARSYRLEFVGVGPLERLSDALTLTAGEADGEPELLEGISRTMRLGLMRFAVEAGLGGDFALAFTSPLPLVGVNADVPAAASETAQPLDDPWNYWNFRAGLSGNMSIQESRSSHRINPSFNADRVTEQWKLNFSVSANLNREKIELSSGTRRNDRDNWSASTLLVRSLGPHFSTGVDMGAGNSIQNNRRGRVTVAPGFEWNYYPYVEASRRQLIAHYAAGAQYNDYYEETVFGVMRETVPLHKIGVQYRQSEGWGNAGVSLDASQYLHDSGLYSFGASGNVSFRVVRGLEISLNASGEKISDQIHIPVGDLSEEDILLGRAALPTGYSYQASVGFSYRWGSSFSNIVNIRFPSVSGGGPGGGGGFGGPGGPGPMGGRGG